MAKHVRTQIRKAVVQALIGLGTTADRVYESRIYPLTEGELPGLLVFTPSEDSGREDSPTELMRDVIVEVHGYAALTSLMEDELDDIALEVETAVDNLGEVSGLAKIYHGIQGMETALGDEDAAKPHGAIRLEFLYTYRTASGSPDVAV